MAKYKVLKSLDVGGKSDAGCLLVGGLLDTDKFPLSPKDMEYLLAESCISLCEDEKEEKKKK